MDGQREVSIERLDERLEHVERAIASIQQTSERIAASLERLVVLETQHAETRAGLGRAFGAIDRIDRRLVSVERRMPLHGLVVNAVLWGAAAVVSAAAAYVAWKTTGMPPG